MEQLDVVKRENKNLADEIKDLLDQLGDGGRSIQASLESEQRAKAEALRIKKKLEGDINELEIALDHANKANSEAQKAIKRYQGQHREAECAYEEEQRQRQEVVEKATLADRRANALAGEMEEARALLDSAERGKRQTEAELAESRAAVNEMNAMSSTQNRITPEVRTRPREHLNASSPRWSRSVQTPTRMQLEEDAMPWPSLKPAFVNWRLNLGMFRQEQVSLARVGRERKD